MGAARVPPTEIFVDSLIFSFELDVIVVSTLDDNGVEVGTEALLGIDWEVLTALRFSLFRSALF